MSNINMVMLSGNITRDPEIRATASGIAVLSFGLAVNDHHKNQQTGEWEEFPNFIECVLMGRRAESLSPILAKGMKVSVGGKLHYSKWQDKNGNNRSKIEVLVNDVELMQQRDSKPQYGAQNTQPTNYTNQQQTYQQAPPQQAQGYSYQSQTQPNTYSLYDEEIPF